MIRSPSTVLRSSPLAATLIAALTILGCGGDEGGGSAGRGGGAGRGGAGGATGVAGRGGSGANTGLAGSTAGRGGAAAGAAGAAGGAAGAAGGVAGAAGGAAGAAGGAAGVAGGAAGAGGGLGGAAGTAPSCVTGASCALAGNVSGVCANGACLNCGSDSACSTAYGTGYICTNPTSAGSCVMGNCHNNNECNGRLCVSNVCTNCPNDAACVTALGANHLCQNGACVIGSCRMNSECGTGQICNATSQCVSCGTNDAACVTAYGNGYICASGACVMGTCHDNGECTTGGQVCTASHTCGPCSGDSSCGTGRICVNNACIQGNCHTNAGCSGGQVCINNACTACTGNTQCTSGQVCLPNGTCTAGNCLAGSDCSASQVCLNNSCTTCATDGQCVSTTTGHGANHLCNGSGACVAGNCRLPGECGVASGLICNTSTLFCGACSGDAACASEYGSGYICNLGPSGGVCIPGNCHSTATPACSSVGQICNLGTHACQACSAGAAGDAQCADTANYGPNHICQNGACIDGNCHVAADCNNSAQICTNFTCGTCTTNTQCTAAYGSNHVCSGGACVSGNCNSSADCAGSNQVCNTTTHLCESCSSNTQCVNDMQYGAMHVCLPNGQCVAGNCRDTSADCTGGQICGITTPRVCGSCGTSDAACRNDATYGNTNICLAGACTVGNCHDTSSDCATGQVCGVTTAHTCGACGTDAHCTGDTRYGAGNICYQGQCGVGNCHSKSDDCIDANAGLICGVSSTNVCGTCGSDSQCKADPFYGTNTICNTAAGANQGKCVTAACSTNNTVCAANTANFCCGGTCTPGNCCTDDDCANNQMFGLGFACSNNNCTQCNNVTGNQYFVDPINGNDLTANGSGRSGGSAAPGCAFKTITRAMQVIPTTPPAGTKIILVGTGASTGLAAGDVLPITLPTNVTLTTQGGPIDIALPANASANNPSGFRLLNNGSAINGNPAAPLSLNGNGMSGIAIQVAPGTSTFTSSIANVTVTASRGDGIRVTAGTVSIGAGVVITGSTNSALRVTGGVVNLSNPAGTQTLFAGNQQSGIWVSGTGSVNVVGTPGAPVPSNNGTVIASFNGVAGIRLEQAVGGAGLVNSIDGVVAWGNTSRDLLVYGGSKLKLRNSVLGAGPMGVQIASLGASAAQNDLSAIDLGTMAEPGRNYLQVPNGALGRHSSAGICVQIAGGQADQTVQAAGNFFATSGNPGTQLNCATGGGTVGVATNCNNGISFGETTTTVITPVFSMCN